MSDYSGWTRTIENTKEWLGESEEYADPRTRPAKVEVDETTGDLKVDLGTLHNLFPALPSTSTSTSTSAQPSDSTTTDPETETVQGDLKILITTSPGKPPAPYTNEFCQDLQALLGGKSTADIVPRRSPKYELGRVARWARGRGYGAIIVVGEDHQHPSLSPSSILF